MADEMSLLERSRFVRARVDTMTRRLHTYRTPPLPPYYTYGLRVPASCVPCVPEAQGSLPLGRGLPYVHRTRTSRRRVVRTAYRGTSGAHQGGRLALRKRRGDHRRRGAGRGDLE